jgi:hypothetical protein
MGGEQAAAVLHLVESEKRQREGRPWAAEEQEEFKRRIRDRRVRIMPARPSIPLARAGVAPA